MIIIPSFQFTFTYTKIICSFSCMYFRIWFQIIQIYYIVDTNWSSLQSNAGNRIRKEMGLIRCKQRGHIGHETRRALERLGHEACTILDKTLETNLKNLCKIGFLMEFFTADFLRVSTKKHQRLTFGWAAEYWPSNPSISGILFKSPNFLRS